MNSEARESHPKPKISRREFIGFGALAVLVGGVDGKIWNTRLLEFKNGNFWHYKLL